MQFDETLSAARQGDRNAIDELFARWRPLLRLQATKLLGAELSARVDPSDVVQETLSQAHQQLDQFHGRSMGEWVTWLRCMVAGHAAKTQRHHHADKRSANRETPADIAFVKSGEISPEDEFDKCEQAVRLAVALEELPDSMRVAVVSRVFLHQSWEEIAQKLNKSPGAARVLWTRALKLLRERLADE